MQSTKCPACESAALGCLHKRPDYEYGVTTRLAYYRCEWNRCGLVFAFPIPVELIPSFYAAYSTHGQTSQRRTNFITRLARRTSMRETTDAIGCDPAGSILDYGCGDGRFLSQLREAAFVNLAGYDFDPNARYAARQLGARVVDDESELQALGPFDAITLNHVIEHLVDPVADIARLSKMLNAGGRIVLRTPNTASALARLFGDAWRGWETPRHLNLFNPESAVTSLSKAALEHLVIERISTSNAMFFGMFHESIRSRAWASKLGKLSRHAAGFALYVCLAVANIFSGRLGEELVVVLQRKPV